MSHLEDELLRARENLFEAKLLERFIPENVGEIAEDEVNPFSDYYGALIFIEKLLRNKQQYKELFANAYAEDYDAIKAALLQNYFVANHRTLTGRLNDRIRQLLKRENVLNVTHDLESLVQQLEQMRLNFSNLPQLGFNFSQIQGIQQEYETLIKNSLQYAEIIQRVMFLLRPQQVSASKEEIQKLLTKYIAEPSQLVYEALLNKSENTGKYLRKFNDLLHKITIAGKEIGEAKFYFKGEEHYATKRFVREWQYFGRLAQQLFDLKEHPYKTRRRFSFKRFTSYFKHRFKPRWQKALSFDSDSKDDDVRLPANPRKKWIALSVSSAIVLGIGTVLYCAPSLRYKLGLPTTNLERVELFYDQGEYGKASDLLKQNTHQSAIEVKYWKNKLRLTDLHHILEGRESFDDKCFFAWKILRADSSGLYQALTDDVKEDVLPFMFDTIGYLHWRNQMKCDDDSSTMKGAVRTHLCTIYNDRSNLDPAEQKLIPVIESGDLLYVEDRGQSAFLLAYDGKNFKEIEYLFRKEDGTLLIDRISISDYPD